MRPFRSHKGLFLYVGPDELPGKHIEAAWKQGPSYVQRLLNHLNSVRIFKRAWPSNPWSNRTFWADNLRKFFNSARSGNSNQSILVTQSAALFGNRRPSGQFIEREQGIRVER